ncbi:MAG: hypothetical protein ACREJG_13660, partial [Candidatus Rokuibacteriota bacterium]
MKNVLLLTTRSYAWTSLEGTLVRHLAAHGVRPIVASARPGVLLDAAAASGLEVAIVPGLADVRTLRG